LKEIESAGLQLVGISYDSVEFLRSFSEKRKLSYPLLSDNGSKTIVAYELLNKEATGKTVGIPYPGTFLLDTDGTIKAKLFLDGYKDRHTTEALIKAANEIK